MTAILGFHLKSITCVGVTVPESFTLKEMRGSYSLHGADKAIAVILL